MNKIQLRFGKKDDLKDLLHLVKLLADFENASHKVTTDIEHYQEQFANGLFRFLVAEEEGKVVGIALFYWSFSTWKGKMMYLEDFVVLPEYRSSGIGQRLFDEFIKISKDEGAKLVKWQVLDWNEGAIRFYERNLASIQKEWYNCVKYF